MLDHIITREELLTMDKQLLAFDFAQPFQNLGSEDDAQLYDILIMLLNTVQELLKTGAPQVSGFEMQKVMSNQWRFYAIKHIDGISDRDLAILSQFSLNLYVVAVENLQKGEEPVFNKAIYIAGKAIMKTFRQLYA